MKIYFAWDLLEEEFNPVSHARQDLCPLSITLTHKEGEAALVHLTVPLKTKVLYNRWAYMAIAFGEEVVPIFYGVLTGALRHQNEETQILEFAARPRDGKHQLARMLEEIKQTEAWNPLFVAPEEDDNPVEALEAQAKLFHWPRVNHQLTLSSYFNGTKELDLSAYVLKDSFTIQQSDQPVASLNVEVIAEWVQEATGDVDLFPVIANHFPEGVINTLTPLSLKQSWPKSGQWLKRSGYFVLHSNLEQVRPLNTGILNLYPDYETVEVSGQTHHYRRFWLEGALLLAWHYRQRRRDIVRFNVAQHNQAATVAPQAKPLRLRLQSLEAIPGCKNAASFFTSEPGLKAINHAIKIAECHLAASARCFEVELNVPLEQGLAIDLDTVVVLKLDCLPQGMVKGKVIAYRFECAFGHYSAWLRLAVATGLGELTANPVLSPDEIIVETPPAGLIDPENLPAAAFVEFLEIRGQVDEQLFSLKAGEEGVIPTSLKLHLRDLSTNDVLESVSSLSAPRLWSAPAHLSLPQEDSNAL